MTIPTFPDTTPNNPRDAGTFATWLLTLRTAVVDIWDYVSSLSPVKTINGNSPDGAGNINITSVSGSAGSVGGVTAPATKPQAASGVGQWVPLYSVTGTAIYVPSGGTWAYYVNNPGYASGGIANVVAGGTLVANGYSGECTGFAWRIA